jgi:alkyldihydroxyacetonephosphate synthase
MAKSTRKTPNWYTPPAPEGSYRSILKLGKPDDVKHPGDSWRTMIAEVLGLPPDHFEGPPRNTGDEKVAIDQGIALGEDRIRAIESIVGAENVDRDDYQRVKFSYGKFTDEATDLRRGDVAPVCDLVVHPRDKNDVRALVQYCNDEGVSVIPYGGGSSASLGFSPERGGIVLVLTTHMNQVVSVNERNQTATVQAGLMAPDYEEALNDAVNRFGTQHAYTCGHFPQSFPLTSVGGWVPTLGSGQASTYYGDAYDIVFSQEYVTPVGSFKTHDFPATATGPKVNDIMKGSEGAFGILVEVTFKIFRYMPENRQYFAFMFPSWEDAVRASQEVMQGEFGHPAVFRISDGEETETSLRMYGGRYGVVDAFLRSRGLKKEQRCLLMGTAEGEKGYARHVKRMVRKIARRHGALYLSGWPARMWEKDRYSHPFLREDMMDFDVMIDTVETPVTWSNIHTVYAAIREFVKSHPDTMCLTHASHFYPQGTNLYAIFGTRFTSKHEFQTLRNGVVDRMVAAGGSPTHHHGVGKLFAPWMQEHLGKEQMAVLRALKRHFDPNNIMNPGSLMGLND